MRPRRTVPEPKARHRRYIPGAPTGHDMGDHPMVRTMLTAAVVAASLAAPIHAQDLGDIVTGVARQYLQQEQDRAAFAQAQAQGTRSAYQSYVRQFPNGAYATEARRQIELLGGGTTAEPSNPYNNAGDSANLDRQQRLTIQRRLNALGYSTNGVDGNFGAGTRRAIALWQRDRNYAQTGSLSTAQANEILRGTTTASTTRPTQAELADAAISGPAQIEAQLGLSASQRRAVQSGLTQRGFSTRGIDGIFGAGTRGAIAGWQRANDMTATGYLTAAQYQRLVQ